MGNAAVGSNTYYYVKVYDLAANKETLSFNLDYTNWTGSWQGELHPADIQSILPPQGEFDAILIDAGAGDDRIIINGTVQKPVWGNGGAGNDTITVDPHDTQSNVLFGGDNDDTIQGGGGSDWIFGGIGDDWLSGGVDGAASDLIFGGPNNDTLQLIPDFVPSNQDTQSDYFDGGTGTNRVVYVGKDEIGGKGVPDCVAIRYYSQWQRYELTSLVAAQNSQGDYGFLVDPTTLLLEQKLSYYQAFRVQQTIIDTRGGNNVVHADPGFSFNPGGQAWGIKPGDYQQGATAGGLYILGGDSSNPGNNILFGGACDDTIIGGAGNDTIVGGDGDDSLVGGGGTDQIYGQSYTGTPLSPIGSNPAILDDPKHTQVSISFPAVDPSVANNLNVPAPPPSDVTISSTSGVAQVSQAFALTGVASGEQLSRFQDVGDVTGDGVDDYLAWGTQSFYLLPGPLSLSNRVAVGNLQVPINSLPLLTGSITAYGTPIDHAGDLDGDGTNDLVLVKSSGGNFVFTTLRGGTALDQSSLSTAHTVTLSNSGIGTTASFDLLDWEGAHTSAGKPIANELLVVGSSGSYLYYSVNLSPTSSATTLGSAQLVPSTPASAPGFGAGLAAAVVGDTQGRGHDDVAFTNPNANTASILYGTQTALTALSLPAGGTVSKPFALGTLQASGYSQFAIGRAANGGTPPSIAIYSTTTTPLVTIPVTGNAGASFSVSPSVLSFSAGDLDGDGLGDLMIGQTSSGSAGQVYVLWSVLKQPTPALADNNLVFSGAISGDQLGTLPMTPAVDVNSDGLSDLVIGAAGANSAKGQLYVVYGTPVTYPQDLAQAQADIAADNNSILTNYSINGTPYLHDTGLARSRPPVLWASAKPRHGTSSAPLATAWPATRSRSRQPPSPRRASH